MGYTSTLRRMHLNFTEEFLPKSPDHVGSFFDKILLCHINPVELPRLVLSMQIQCHKFSDVVIYYSTLFLTRTAKGDESTAAATTDL